METCKNIYLYRSAEPLQAVQAVRALEQNVRALGQSVRRALGQNVRAKC